MIALTDCKINIGLDIVERRPDGYHNLVSAFVHVPWHDVVEIIPAGCNDTTLTVFGNKVDCPPEKNLVMKAYRLLQAEFNLPPIRILLQKNVPDGAGLGGGSSDATATLKLLNTMFSLGLDNDAIAARAAKLGADCPFFAYDTDMLVEGIGDVMRPVTLPLDGYWIWVEKPKTVSISTAQAYAGVMPAKPEIPLGQLLLMSPEMWKDRVKNDFEHSIFPLAPEIKALKERMYARGAVYAAMSGSGASVFGVFEEKPAFEPSKTSLLFRK